MTAVVEAEPSVVRTAAGITVGNGVSRATGFVRVVAVGAALGTTYLGNTYQTSNLVSNVLFELLAAGLLSAVLVPRFVALIEAGDRADAEELAGALLGVGLVVLGAVVVAGAIGGTWIMRGLTVAVGNAAVRRQEIAVGAFFLWFFLPQVLLYAWGAVTTAVLYADRRFAAAAFAPIGNNVVVVATMALFWFVRHRAAGVAARPSLELPVEQRLLLAVGTTVGVVAMTAIPAVAAWRAGFRVRPRWHPGHPGLHGLRRAGLWAVGFLALNQLLIGATLVLANRVEGGVVAYQIAFTFFLLPHALFGQPVMTALYPRLASDAVAGRYGQLRRDLRHGLRLMALLLLPSAVVLAVAGGPALRLVAIGALGRGDSHLIARVLAAYAIGLVGYSSLQFLTRASYAVHDASSPTLVNLAVTMAGAALMVLGTHLAHDGDRVVSLGAAHSLVMLLGAGALAVLVRRRVIAAGVDE